MHIDRHRLVCEPRVLVRESKHNLAAAWRHEAACVALVARRGHHLHLVARRGAGWDKARGELDGVPFLLARGPAKLVARKDADTLLLEPTRGHQQLLDRVARGSTVIGVAPAGAHRRALHRVARLLDLGVAVEVLAGLVELAGVDAILGVTDHVCEAAGRWK